MSALAAWMAASPREAERSEVSAKRSGLRRTELATLLLLTAPQRSVLSVALSDCGREGAV
jgi:hypothetical protein